MLSEKVGCFLYASEGKGYTYPFVWREVIITYITLEQILLLATLLVAILALVHDYYDRED